ncbi:TetR/AcrR family transcriptional regulator [Cupriavidus sp. CP313]
MAKKLLLEGGSLEFSLRAVALGAGISISNLQYYFPTRQAVLRAIMAPIIDAYLEDLKRALDSRLAPREALDALMEKALADARNAKDAALWWHFVALASTDPECARMFDEWYDTITRGIAELARAVNPELYERKPACRLAADCHGRWARIAARCGAAQARLSRRPRRGIPCRRQSSRIGGAVDRRGQLAITPSLHGRGMTGNTLSFLGSMFVAGVRGN